MKRHSSTGRQNRTRLQERLWRVFLGALLLSAGAAAGFGVGALSRAAHGKIEARPQYTVPPPLLVLKDFAVLTNLDIATVNLCCAEGLPGAEGLDLRAATATLDDWAKRIASETERHLTQFQRNPAEFNHSEAYFRILTLVTVLQQDLGVNYDLERIRSPDFSDARDVFLHGLLTGKRQGTCVSMPVLYVAVGRRLGYPLKLVTTKGHLFARWESRDGQERFNIKATNEGLNCFPDEYYHTWPVQLTPAELAAGQYLKSLTPGEELAVFLSARGHCLEATGRLAEAQLAYAQAHVLAPRWPLYLAFLTGAVSKEMSGRQGLRPDLGKVAALVGVGPDSR